MSLPTKLPPPIAPCPATRTINCDPSNLQQALDSIRAGDRLLLDGDFNGRTWRMLDKGDFSQPVSIEARQGGRAYIHDSRSNGGSQCPLWINNCGNFHLVGLELSDPPGASGQVFDGAKLDNVRNARVYRCSFHDIAAQGLICRYYCRNVWYDACHIRMAGQGYNPVPDEWKDKEGKHATYLGWSNPPISEGFVVINCLIEEQAKGSAIQGLFRNSIIAYNTIKRFLMREIGDDAGYALNVWEDDNLRDQVRDNVATSNLIIECLNGFQASKWTGANVPLLTVWKNAFYKVAQPVRTRYGNFDTVKDLGGHVILQDGWTLADLAGKGDVAFQPAFDYAGNERSGGTIGHLQAGGTPPPPPPPARTNVELVAEAKDHLRKTKSAGANLKVWPPTDKNSEWYKALAALGQIK